MASHAEEQADKLARCLMNKAIEGRYALGDASRLLDDFVGRLNREDDREALLGSIRRRIREIKSQPDKKQTAGAATREDIAQWEAIVDIEDAVERKLKSISPL